MGTDAFEKRVHCFLVMTETIAKNSPLQTNKQTNSGRNS